MRGPEDRDIKLDVSEDLCATCDGGVATSLLRLVASSLRLRAASRCGGSLGEVVEGLSAASDDCDKAGPTVPKLSIESGLIWKLGWFGELGLESSVKE